MTDEEPVFSMSKYISTEAMYKDMALYYRGEYRKLKDVRSCVYAKDYNQAIDDVSAELQIYFSEFIHTMDYLGYREFGNRLQMIYKGAMDAVNNLKRAEK